MLRTLYRGLLIALLIASVAAERQLTADQGLASANLVDPRSDPKYEQIAASGYSQLTSQFAPDTALQRQFNHEYEAFTQARIQEDERITAAGRQRKIVIIMASIFLTLLIVSFLPVRRWIERIVNGVERDVAAVSGIASRTVSSVEQKIVRLRTEAKGAQIIGSDRLARFSTSEKLMRWKSLRDTGTITEEEFQDAVAKLMKRDT